MFGHPLTVLQIATLCLSIMFASVGAGGIPGGSIFLLKFFQQILTLTGGNGNSRNNHDPSSCKKFFHKITPF